MTSPSSSPNQTDRRTSVQVVSKTKQAFLQRLKHEYFLDILRARNHSRHFRHTRANTLNIRIRIIAGLWGVLIPLWTLVDALYLSEGALEFIGWLRGVTGALLLLLALWSHERHNLFRARIRLALLVAIPSLFQTIAHLQLIDGNGQGLPPGYHFFPFIIISLAAVFPLTILESTTLALAVIALHAGTALWLGTLTSTATLNDLWLLVLLALISGFAAVTQLQMMMQLYRQAHRDPLTGLANRRSIISYLEREVAQSREDHLPLSLILVDLDRFKRINDTWGHAAGDEVLKSFSRLLVRESRSQDLVGRFGGEEFLMILSATPRDGAKAVAERIRAACHQEQVPVPGSEPIGYTASIGVTELRDGEQIEEMLKRVDEALYEAKGGGRDRVVLA